MTSSGQINMSGNDREKPICDFPTFLFPTYSYKIEHLSPESLSDCVE